MAIQRIAVLCATFFLVALSPRFDMALFVFGFGLFTYLVLWCYDIFRGKGTR